MSFREEEFLEFSKLVQDKVVGTCTDGVATIWDLNTSQRLRTLTPTNSNAYTRNRATFDPTDDLILCDGVLWDQRGKIFSNLPKQNIVGYQNLPSLTSSSSAGPDHRRPHS